MHRAAELLISCSEIVLENQFSTKKESVIAVELSSVTANTRICLYENECPTFGAVILFPSALKWQNRSFVFYFGNIFYYHFLKTVWSVGRGRSCRAQQVLPQPHLSWYPQMGFPWTHTPRAGSTVRSWQQCEFPAISWFAGRLSCPVHLQTPRECELTSLPSSDIQPFVSPHTRIILKIYLSILVQARIQLLWVPGMKQQILILQKAFICNFVKLAGAAGFAFQLFLCLPGGWSWILASLYLYKIYEA